MHVPHIVSDSEWRRAVEEIHAEEKRAARERDALAARRRRLLPWPWMTLPLPRPERTTLLAPPGGISTLVRRGETRWPTGRTRPTASPRRSRICGGVDTTSTRRWRPDDAL